MKWALDRTIALGLSDLSLHAGFIPEPGDAAADVDARDAGTGGRLAAAKGITLAFETGQETADLLRLTLDELRSPSLKVNFDPANMLLYDMGDPIRAVEILGPDIRSVHVKDARRPNVAGPLGRGSALGEGEVDIKRFVQALKKIGYTGPLIIEREVGDQAGRLRDVARGLASCGLLEDERARSSLPAYEHRPAEAALDNEAATAGGPHRRTTPPSDLIGSRVSGCGVARPDRGTRTRRARPG